MAVQSPGMEVLVDAAGDVQRYHCEVSVGVGVPLNVAVPVRVSPSNGEVSLIDAAADTEGATAIAVPPEEKLYEKSPPGFDELIVQDFVVKPLPRLVVFGAQGVLHRGVFSDLASPLGK